MARFDRIFKYVGMALLKSIPTMNGLSVSLRYVTNLNHVKRQTRPPYDPKREVMIAITVVTVVIIFEE